MLNSCLEPIWVSEKGNSARGNVECGCPFSLLNCALGLLSFPPYCSLILIPGLGPSSTKDWSIMSSEWQSFLELTESRVNIYSYNYKLKLSNGFSFRMLLDEGHSFLAAVNEHREAASFSFQIYIACSISLALIPVLIDRQALDVYWP